MREGWTYKKLGEVCKAVMGQSPDGNSVNTSNGIEFHQGKVFFGEKFLNFSNTYTVQPSKIAEPNSVLLCVRAPVGIVNITPRKICIGRGLCAIQPKDCICMPFLFYALTQKKAYFDKNSTGSTFKAISSKVVANTDIPVPPLSEQQRIVSELDLLSSIIEKKKVQLKEYDQLAQSIFYDMFGDPVTNEKGWEVKKLGEVCEILAGGDKPANISNVRTKDYCFPVIANGDGEKGILGYSRTRRIIKDSVTIGARGASIGNCRIVYGGFTPVVRLITLTPDSSVNCSYLFYFANLMPYNSNGAGQAQLTVPNVRNVSFPLPPLTLQQSFASKIEEIERLKALIQQSIIETETLFNSRMDYFFN